MDDDGWEKEWKKEKSKKSVTRGRDQEKWLYLHHINFFSTLQDNQQNFFQDKNALFFYPQTGIQDGQLLLRVQ